MIVRHLIGYNSELPGPMRKNYIFRKKINIKDLNKISVENFLWRFYKVSLSFFDFEYRPKKLRKNDDAKELELSVFNGKKCGDNCCSIRLFSFKEIRIIKNKQKNEKIIILHYARNLFEAEDERVTKNHAALEKRNVFFKFFD